MQSLATVGEGCSRGTLGTFRPSTPGQRPGTPSASSRPCSPLHAFKGRDGQRKAMRRLFAPAEGGFGGTGSGVGRGTGLGIASGIGFNGIGPGPLSRPTTPLHYSQGGQGLVQRQGQGLAIGAQGQPKVSRPQTSHGWPGRPGARGLRRAGQRVACAADVAADLAADLAAQGAGTPAVSQGTAGSSGSDGEHLEQAAHGRLANGVLPVNGKVNGVASAGHHDSGAVLAFDSVTGPVTGTVPDPATATAVKTGADIVVPLAIALRRRVGAWWDREGEGEWSVFTAEPEPEEESQGVPQDSVTDAPVTKQPVAEEAPVTKQAVTEEALVTKQAVAEEAPVTKQAVTEEALVTKQAVTEEAPVTKQAVTEEAPVTKRAVTGEEPVTKQAVTEEAPVSKTLADALVTELDEPEGTPVTEQEVSDKAAVTEAAVTEAAVTEAVVTEAAVTEAAVTEAVVTEGTLGAQEPVTEVPESEAAVTHGAVDQKAAAAEEAVAVTVTVSETETVTVTEAVAEAVSESETVTDSETVTETENEAVTVTEGGPLPAVVTKEGGGVTEEAQSAHGGGVSQSESAASLAGAPVSLSDSHVLLPPETEAPIPLPQHVSALPKGPVKAVIPPFAKVIPAFVPPGPTFSPEELAALAQIGEHRRGLNARGGESDGEEAGEREVGGEEWMMERFMDKEGEELGRTFQAQIAHVQKPHAQGSHAARNGDRVHGVALNGGVAGKGGGAGVIGGSELHNEFQNEFRNEFWQELRQEFGHEAGVGHAALHAPLHPLPLHATTPLSSPASQATPYALTSTQVRAAAGAGAVGGGSSNGAAVSAARAGAGGGGGAGAGGGGVGGAEGGGSGIRKMSAQEIGGLNLQETGVRELAEIVQATAREILRESEEILRRTEPTPSAPGAGAVAGGGGEGKREGVNGSARAASPEEASFAASLAGSHPELASLVGGGGVLEADPKAVIESELKAIERAAAAAEAAAAAALAGAGTGEGLTLGLQNGALAAHQASAGAGTGAVAARAFVPAVPPSPPVETMAAEKAAILRAEQEAKRVLPDILLYYETGWPEAYIHFKTADDKWTDVPGLKMGEFVAPWDANQKVKVFSLQGDTVEFVFNNGHGNWDSPAPGRNYHVGAKGEYYVSCGKVLEAPKAKAEE